MKSWVPWCAAHPFRTVISEQEPLSRGDLVFWSAAARVLRSALVSRPRRNRQTVRSPPKHPPQSPPSACRPLPSAARRALNAAPRRCRAFHPWSRRIRTMPEIRPRRDVVRLVDPTEGRLRFHHFTKIAVGNAGGVPTLGFDHSGADGVDADLARPQLLGQAFCDRHDGRLGAAGPYFPRPVPP